MALRLNISDCQLPVGFSVAPTTELAKHFVKDVGTFDPSNPDPPDKVVIPVSPVVGATEKPAGN